MTVEKRREEDPTLRLVQDARVVELPLVSMPYLLGERLSRSERDRCRAILGLPPTLGTRIRRAMGRIVCRSH